MSIPAENPIKQFSRSARLLGWDALENLSQKTVAVFGLGGVGSFAAEALIRGGIGHIILIDGDGVDITNINRQLVALHSTLGQNKAEVMAARARDINPHIRTTVYTDFYRPDSGQPMMEGADYVVDAIDQVSAKIGLVMEARERGIPIISCMGAGNHIDPARLEISDLFKTSVCPLCKVMRRELGKREVDKLDVVFTEEPPLKPIPSEEDAASVRRAIPGSVSFVPPVAGMMLASHVLKMLAGVEG